MAWLWRDQFRGNCGAFRDGVDIEVHKICVLGDGEKHLRDQFFITQRFIEYGAPEKTYKGDSQASENRTENCFPAADLNKQNFRASPVWYVNHLAGCWALYASFRQFLFHVPG